jgi:polysaccharide biosynthesis PFTS motif protein
MPITTPSLIAKSYEKNSLYFDPLGVIKRDDPALRQIPLASNPIELQNIINSMKNKWVSGR